jgi:D-threo-aldose 1-dehydrogenase
MAERDIPATAGLSRRELGGTGLSVTEIGFGTAGIGGLYQAVPERAAEAALAAAWERGIRHFDTAPYYGHGRAERRLGDFLRAQRGAAYVLSTKVGRLLRPVPEDQVPDCGFGDPLPFAVDYDYSYDGIMRSVEASFARLGLNRIDILYAHDIGAYTHGAANAAHQAALLGSGLKALERLRDEKVIKGFGLGVNEVEVCLEVMARTRLDCILLAGRYTLLDRSAVPTLLARAAEAGTAIIAGGVFNSGILATGAGAAAQFNYAAASPEILGKVARLQAVAARHGVSLIAAALAFPLRHPSVAGVLFGAADPATVRHNMDLYEQMIPAQAWEDFDAALGAGALAADG